MKKLYLLAAAAIMGTASVSAQTESRAIAWLAPEFVAEDWNYIGIGYEIPGVFDYFRQEDGTMMEGEDAIECRVYESTTKSGEYWFEPQTQNLSTEEMMFPGPFIVHASNPNAVYTDPIWFMHPMIFCAFPMVPEILGIQGSAAYYGKVEDAVAITFPASSYIIGTFPTGTPVTNTEGAFMLYLPENTGISDVSADDSEAVYYNLQGVAVENPGHGVFIKKSGSSVKKVRM